MWGKGRRLGDEDQILPETWVKSGRETRSERQMEEWLEMDSAGEGTGSRD